MTHSRGLLAKTIESSRRYFSADAFTALELLIETVNKVDYVKVRGADIKQQHELNIVIIGDKFTGKHALRKKFSMQKFDNALTPSCTLLFRFCT